jgi:hypothetical protein
MQFDTTQKTISRMDSKKKGFRAMKKLILIVMFMIAAEGLCISVYAQESAMKAKDNNGQSQIPQKSYRQATDHMLGVQAMLDRNELDKKNVETRMLAAGKNLDAADARHKRVLTKITAEKKEKVQGLFDDLTKLHEQIKKEQQAFLSELKIENSNKDSLKKSVAKILEDLRMADSKDKELTEKLDIKALKNKTDSSGKPSTGVSAH